jgi:hypothetical protein
MPGDPSNLIPYQWAPGQSGNPSGGTAKRRAARRLREALDLVLGDEVPEWLISRLPPELVDDLPTGTSFAELIALRLVWAAATATNPSQVLTAASLILAATGKPDTLAAREAVGTPKLPTTEERRRSVAEQLGVILEPEPPAPNAH